MASSKQPVTSDIGGSSRQEPLIRVQNVKKHYRQNASFLEKMLARQKDKVVYAVDDVSFDIYPGETLGLVGESGCGKSTLGRTVIQLHEATEGRILYRNQDVSKLSGDDLHKYRQKNQIIFQNPYASLNPRKTVRDIIKVALVSRGITKHSDQEAELRQLIEQVGLSQRHLDNYPHQFSGGQRQRIGIARALAMKPDFIVADEPVSALDVSVQAQIVNLLEELQEQYELTFLFVAHDLSVVHYVSDRVAVMYLGQLIELAETTELFNNPQHPYTQALLSSIPVVNKSERRERIILQGSVSTPLEQPKGCLFQNRCMHRIGDICSQERPKWVEHNGHGVACHLIR
ncbi:ABC transporter ATP-binding protein [Paenibacillus piri]|uniref:ABC transporter ATP-binding protein n=1 Tax=Paenibacillus piri TaxID=2547395 RepID=UPI002482D1A6|nr:oligopeptide/dipeptide ABC transporter ATP-binding protein [Paenibacillus piri]